MRRRHQAILLGLVWLCLSAAGRATVYPWVVLVPEHDSRDPEMVMEDEAESRGCVETINNSEKLFDHHLVWGKVPIRRLLEVTTPFCEIRFDAIHPLLLTDEEKKILKEYFQRGGFLFCMIDAYPYSEEQFWPVSHWAFIDFLTRELPAADPGFTVGRATDQFPIFSFYYKTETADAIRHELSGNVNTPNRTLLFYRGRLCVFVMGQYNYLEDGHWVPMERPFPMTFSAQLKSYQLIVNVYAYSIAH